jgi:hypothetical protein
MGLNCANLNLLLISNKRVAALHTLSRGLSFRGLGEIQAEMHLQENEIDSWISSWQV